jgi:hypothetical protein
MNIDKTPLSPLTNWETFFNEIQPWTSRPDSDPFLFRIQANMRLGSYMTVSGGDDISLDFQSFRVTPRLMVTELAEQHLIEVENDTTHFNLIIFANEAHLYLEYGQIIGSRLLAKLRLDTIPKCIKTKE